MTSGSQSQPEVVAVKLGALCTKTKTRIGFWNIRTIFITGRLAYVTKEMNEKSFTFLVSVNAGGLDLVHKQQGLVKRFCSQARMITYTGKK